MNRAKLGRGIGEEGSASLPRSPRSRRSLPASPGYFLPFHHLRAWNRLLWPPILTPSSGVAGTRPVWAARQCHWKLCPGNSWLRTRTPLFPFVIKTWEQKRKNYMNTTLHQSQPVLENGFNFTFVFVTSSYKNYGWLRLMTKIWYRVELGRRTSYSDVSGVSPSVRALTLGFGDGLRLGAWATFNSWGVLLSSSPLN